MTLPKGWKKESTTATTIKKENLTEQREQSGSKNNQSSIISAADKINIQELIAKYNQALDNKAIEEWTNTWSDDGVWSTPFGEAKGKTELKNIASQITNEFASGKRHVSTNIIIENGTNNTASAQSYLIVIEAKRTPEVVATGTYIDTLKKDANNKWKFLHRRLEIDLVIEAN
jgi:ketosteroid isomerase-like protein